MKKLLFGIFAHPDDEAFGPSGTLYKEVRSNTEVHLICVTDGDAGRNCDHCDNLGEVRLQEWRESARLIGAASIKALHYPDGRLCNEMFHDISRDINKYITETIDAADKPASIGFMTFDGDGLTGHLDHIAVSRIASQLYYTLREQPPEGCEISKLRYFCLADTLQPKPDTSWVFMPAGRHPNQIDETVDISDVYENKLAIMRAHQSQRDDMQMILQRSGDELQREHFWYAP